MPQTKKKVSAYTHMNEPEFIAIKRLQDAGVNKRAAISISGRSQGTIDRIYEAKDFDAYKKNLHDHFTKYPTSTPKKAEVQAKPSDDLTTPVRLAKVPETNDLARIANALERLANAWEASPKRTGLFSK